MSECYCHMSQVSRPIFPIDILQILHRTNRFIFIIFKGLFLWEIKCIIFPLCITFCASQKVTVTDKVNSNFCITGKIPCQKIIAY